MTDVISPDTASRFVISHFENPEPDSPEFQKALDVRLEVFVREQGVPEDEERDDYDAECTHWLMTDGETGEPVATGRMMSYQEGCQMRPVAKIGRVAVRKPYRSQKLGRMLMRSMLEAAQQEGFEQVILDSQTTAMKFYESLGFEAEGDEFLDAGIPHYRMRLVW